MRKEGSGHIAQETRQASSQAPHGRVRGQELLGPWKPGKVGPPQGPERGTCQGCPSAGKKAKGQAGESAGPGSVCGDKHKRPGLADACEH